MAGNEIRPDPIVSRFISTALGALCAVDILTPFLSQTNTNPPAAPEATGSQGEKDQQ